MKLESLINAKLKESPGIVNKPFQTSENLESRYGGTGFNETGMVQTETVGGCGTCGTAHSVKHSYFYLTMRTSTDPNVVTKLVVEDTQDDAGAAPLRQAHLTCPP